MVEHPPFKRRVARSSRAGLKNFMIETLCLIIFSLAIAGAEEPPRKYLIETVGPIALVQIYADGFENLKTNEKILAYYLSRSGMEGDSIYYDQISRYGWETKEILDALYPQLPNVREKLRAPLAAYIKLFWIHHGFYEQDSSRKFLPGFTFEEFRSAALPLLSAASPEKSEKQLEYLKRPIFDPHFLPMLTVKNPPSGQDLVTAGANNLYEGVSLKEVEAFPARYRLNSRLAKKDGQVYEEIYRLGALDGRIPPGRYAQQLKGVVENVEKALEYAEPPSRCGGPGTAPQNR